MSKHNKQIIAMMPMMTTHKPKYNEPCNQCGYCCATEVCAMGKSLGGGEIAPCKHLMPTDDPLKTRCNLVTILGEDSEFAKDLGINTGCDAMTVVEALENNCS